MSDPPVCRHCGTPWDMHDCEFAPLPAEVADPAVATLCSTCGRRDNRYCSNPWHLIANGIILHEGVVQKNETINSLLARVAAARKRGFHQGCTRTRAGVKALLTEALEAAQSSELESGLRGLIAAFERGEDALLEEALEIPPDVWAAAKRQGAKQAMKRAVEWVDYHLGMPLQPEAADVLRSLRRRLAHEAEHGPLTSVPMRGEHRREGEGVTIVDRRCRAVSPQGTTTCGLEKGHEGEHNALGWGVDLGEEEG